MYENEMPIPSSSSWGGADVWAGSWLERPTPVQENSAKQDMKDAGHETKNAAKDAGRGTKQGTKKVYRSTKRGTKKAWNKTKNTTKGAANGAREGAKQPD
jgi:hypothetical protein